ncbi:MAG: MBL fold metallo-hydrolase [Dehalococcoidia bacterium]|nr:MBL fold metallo-hydrolase [Dehalococcoidia bacterium]
MVNTNVGIIGFCTVVLIEGEKRVLFDSAHVGRRTYMQEQLRVRGLTPDDVDIQVLSHAHWDHIQNLDVCKNAPIIVHPDERAYAWDPHPNDWATPSWTGPVLESVSVIEAGEGYEIMPGCKVIELPGHSPGSIGLEVESEDGTWIITGDAIHAAPIAQAGANPLIFWNQEQAAASIRRVTQSGAIILPGHDRPFRMKNGEIEYFGEFSMRINGANPETPGLGFDAAGPKYITGNAEGWEKGEQRAWIMPGLEEQAARVKSGRSRITTSRVNG